MGYAQLMQLRPLVVWGLLLLFSSSARGDAVGMMRSLEELEKDQKSCETLMAEAQSELASTIEKQKRNRKPEFAAELERMRSELEGTLATLAEEKRQLAESRQTLMATLDTRKPCPICGGKLTRIKDVARKDQHKNREVLAAARRPAKGCGNIDFLDISPVCTRCWAAQPVGSDRWRQSSNDPDGFVVPLTPVIANAPRPPVNSRKVAWMFETFQRAGEKRQESALLWWDDPPPEYVTALKEYAEKHALQFRDVTTGPCRLICISTPDEKLDAGIPGL